MFNAKRVRRIHTLKFLYRCLYHERSGSGPGYYGIADLEEALFCRHEVIP